MSKKKLAKKVKSFKCPNCSKEQTSVIEWQTMSVGYEHNLTTKDSKEVDSVLGDFENWTCPSCGKDLPTTMYTEIAKMIISTKI